MIEKDTVRASFGAKEAGRAVYLRTATIYNVFLFRAEAILCNTRRVPGRIRRDDSRYVEHAYLLC
jgi:hypothetical protein